MPNPLAPPASWENATPVFGIRYPKVNAPAKYLPDAFGHIGLDLENALVSDAATPPGLNYKTGTKAQRLAATPVANQIWVETDTAGNPKYIGSGTAWIPLDQSTVHGFLKARANGSSSGYGQSWISVPFDTLQTTQPAADPAFSFSVASRGFVVNTADIYSISANVTMTGTGYLVRLFDGTNSLGMNAITSTSLYTGTLNAVAYLAAGAIVTFQVMVITGQLGHQADVAANPTNLSMTRLGLYG